MRTNQLQAPKAKYVSGLQRTGWGTRRSGWTIFGVRARPTEL